MAVYNNPALGQSFENIAALFAPPSSADLANYATAAGRRQQNDIIAKLAQSPDYAGFDHQAILADLYDPTQSFYRVNTDDATARRGQDITAATSRANNAADNQRQFITEAFGALNQGQVRPEVPGGISGLFGVNQALPAVAGAPKPMSESEVKGDWLQQIYGQGLIKPKDVASQYKSETNIEQVQGPNGPLIVSRDASIGMEPYINKGAQAKPELYSYRTPEGKVGTAIVGPANSLVDSQTGETLPPGTRAAKATMQGSAEEVGMGPTTANTTQANNRRAEVTRTLGTLDLYEGLLTNNPGSVGLPGLIRGTAQNAIAAAQDLAASFGKSVPEVEQFTADLQDGLKTVAPELFDPTISEALFYEGTLAYALARTENPSGEVSRQAFERALDRVRGGFLQNTQSAMSAVNAFRKVLEQELSAIKVLDDPATARTDTGYQGAAPPAATGQEPVPQTQADLPRVNTPEEAARLPKGAHFIDPNGVERVVP